VKVGAVVVAYHRPDALAPLLGQLLDERAHVVVVNVEDDERVAKVAADAGVLAAPLPNRGYAAAVNHGASLVPDDAEVVVFMNDDLRLRRDALRRLTEAIERGADVALPRVVDEAGSADGTLLPLPTPGRILLEWALLPDRRPRRVPSGAARRVEKWRPVDVPGRVQAGTAALVAVRREVLAGVPLDETYFMYWEELDWFWRLHQRGADVRLAPGAAVEHHGGRDDVRPEKAELLARNAVRCVRRTQGWLSAAAVWPIVIAWQLRLWLVDRSRPSGRDRLAARRAGVRAALSAWRELT